MASRAVWRRPPEDPRSPFGWALVERERQLRPAREGLGCLSKIGAIGLFVTGHPTIAIGVLLAWAVLKRVRGRPRPVEPLLTLPMPTTAYPCEVDVLRGDTVVGTDRGAVTFLDGWLHFEGFRTTFSLSRADVRRRDQNGLDLEKGGVEFHPDDSSDREFSSALDRWYRLDPAARGISILPPLVVHPSGLALAWADFAFALAKVAFFVGAMFVVYSMSSVYGWVVLLFGSPGDMFIAARKVKALQRLQDADRRALANETPAPLGS